MSLQSIPAQFLNQPLANHVMTEDQNVSSLASAKLNTIKEVDR